MNNLRLLTGLLAAVLSGGGVCAYGQRVITLEEVYDSAERNSAQLRPYFTADEVAAREVAEARSAMLPDINATLSVSYIGDGFTTKRDFSDYERAPIPQFGNGLSLARNLPLHVWPQSLSATTFDCNSPVFISTSTSTVTCAR